MEQLVFSTFQLVIEDKSPLMSDFRNISNETFKHKGTIYKVSCEKINNDRFFWLYAKHGSSLPYSDEAININNLTKIIKNKRQENEAELNHQVFAVYDNLNKTFYISNSHKTSFIQSFLKKKLSKDIIVKRYFISPEEFIEKIKSIGTISLTSKRNLFSQRSGLFENATDIFGLGQPEDFKININYNWNHKTEKFKSFFKKFIDSQKQMEIESLVL